MAVPPKPVSLQGTAPTIFTGDRSLSETFMRDFKIYKIMNPVKVRQDLVLDVSKSGSIGVTKQDLIKIKSRSSGESFQQVLTSNNSAQIRSSPFSLQG
jgi:hypothetical protein